MGVCGYGGGVAAVCKLLAIFGLNFLWFVVFRKIKKSRIWAIFEPRSATSRRKVFQKQFSQCFDQADNIVLCSIFAPERLSSNLQLNLEQLVSDLRKQSCHQVEFYSSANEIVEHVSPKLLPGDKVVIMSNGGFDNIHTKLLDALN